MKKIFLYIALFVCVFVFVPEPAHADFNALKSWCIEHGQSWDADTITCTVTGQIDHYILLASVDVFVKLVMQQAGVRPAHDLASRLKNYDAIVFTVGKLHGVSSPILNLVRTTDEWVAHPPGLLPRYSKLAKSLISLPLEDKSSRFLAGRGERSERSTSVIMLAQKSLSGKSQALGPIVLRLVHTGTPSRAKRS